MENYPNVEAYQKEIIRSFLAPYAISLLLSENPAALARRMDAGDNEVVQNIRQATLAPFSTDSDADEARALILGPAKIDDCHTSINLSGLYLRADRLTSEIIGDPLELSFDAELGMNFGDDAYKSNLSMNRHATFEEYSGMIYLLNTARKRDENPDSYPLDPTMFKIVQEKFIWRLASDYPSPEQKNIKSELLESMLKDFYEAQHHTDTPHVSSEIALRRTDDEHRHNLLILNKIDNDYELRFFDPATKELEIYVIGPWSDNMWEENVIAELPNDKQEEVMKVLKTGDLLDRKAFRLTYGADVEMAEVKLYQNRDGDRFQEESHFPDLDLG